MEYDELITKYLGELGLYQILVLIAICITDTTLAFNIMGTVFILGNPGHWCAIHDLDRLDISTDVRLNFSIPLEEVDGQMVYSSCKMYDRDYTNWTQSDVQDALFDSNNETSVIKCRDGWIYEQSMYTSTAVSDFDMVCDRRYLQATATSVFMAGMMVGVIVTGTLSDQFGRKLTMSVCIVVMVACNFVIAFSQNVTVFLILRFILAMASIGQLTCAFILGIEIVGPSRRPQVMAIMQGYWIFGYMLLPAIAYGIRDWRHLNLTITVPFVLLFFFFFIPESPRWLYATKKYEKADKVVRLMARVNKKKLPDKLLISVKKEKKAYVWDILKTPRLRLRSLNVFFNWFVNSFVYYGLSLNTSNLVGNLHLNFFLLGVAEIPASIFCQIGPAFLGRRVALVASLILAGVSFLLTIAVPNDFIVTIVTLSMIGKFGISTSFLVIYVFTAELYPTPVRNVSVGAGSFFARIGGVIAPYVIELSYYGRSIPIIIYGVMSIIAGLLALLLPETKGQNLPETLEDGENFGRKSKFQEKHCKDIDTAENLVDAEQKMELCPDNTNNSNSAVINSSAMDKSFQTEL